MDFPLMCCHGLLLCCKSSELNKRAWRFDAAKEVGKRKEKGMLMCVRGFQHEQAVKFLGALYLTCYTERFLKKDPTARLFKLRF